MEKAHSVERAVAEPSNRSLSRSNRKPSATRSVRRLSIGSQSPQRASPLRSIKKPSEQKLMPKVLSPAPQPSPIVQKASAQKESPTRQPSPVKVHFREDPVSIVRISPKKDDSKKVSSDKFMQNMLSQAREINSNKTHLTRTSSATNTSFSKQRNEFVCVSVENKTSRIKSPVNVPKFSPPKPEKIVNNYID